MERKADEHDASDTDFADGTTQVQAGQQDQEEFKEGGYGWFVVSHLPSTQASYTHCCCSPCRIVVLAVAMLNSHTWGLNSVRGLLREQKEEGSMCVAR
jgi:hypothetical protein